MSSYCETKKLYPVDEAMSAPRCSSSDDIVHARDDAITILTAVASIRLPVTPDNETTSAVSNTSTHDTATGPLYSKRYQCLEHQPLDVSHQPLQITRIRYC